MTVYQEKFAEFLREVGNGKKMVLSTSGHAYDERYPAKRFFLFSNRPDFPEIRPAS